MMQRQWGPNMSQVQQHSSLIDTEDEAKHLGSQAMAMGTGGMMNRGLSEQNSL